MRSEDSKLPVLRGVSFCTWTPGAPQSSTTSCSQMGPCWGTRKMHLKVLGGYHQGFWKISAHLKVTISIPEGSGTG